MISAAWGTKFVLLATRGADAHSRILLDAALRGLHVESRVLPGDPAVPELHHVEDTDADRHPATVDAEQ